MNNKDKKKGSVLIQRDLKKCSLISFSTDAGSKRLLAPFLQQEYLPVQAFCVFLHSKCIHLLAMASSQPDTYCIYKSTNACKHTNIG